MPKNQQSLLKKRVEPSLNSAAVASENVLRLLAFENSIVANVITLAKTGKIIVANPAACKLLGYTKKQILNQSRSSIFDISEASFKQMLKQRTTEGKSAGTLTAIKNNGKTFPCEITSTLFIDQNGVEMAITTIVEITKRNAELKKLTRAGHKSVAQNIDQAAAKSGEELSEINKWINYIAKTSYDVMWDWEIATGQIYVGKSIRHLFGYKLHGNTIAFTEFINCLAPKDKNAVEKKLAKTLISESKSWSDSFHLIHFDGSIASTTSRAYIVRDGKGEAVHLIGATQDVSRLKKLEKKLKEQVTIQKEQTEKFLLAAKLSFDGIWDWDLITNEFFLGAGFEELFGYDLTKINGDIATNWSDYLHPDDKDSVEKGLHNAIESHTSYWEHSHRLLRADGSVAKVFGRASILRDAEGKAYRMTGAIHDFTRQNDLEERLKEEINAKDRYEENFKLIFNSTSDVLFDMNLLTNEVVINDAYEKKYGHRLNGNMTRAEAWECHIHPDDRASVVKEYHTMLASNATEWKCSYRFLKADSSVANISSSRIILRDKDGIPYRLIGSMQDLSTQKTLEERLDREIKLKEKQIERATEEARATERSDIGKELHDNVNQLLGASKLYLSMAKKGGDNSEMFLNRSAEYTIKAIDEIRRLTKGLETDDIKKLGLIHSINNLSRDMTEASLVKISCKANGFIEDSVNKKFKLNMFRIIQEELNNILKHAKATDVLISLSQNKKRIALTIADNGVGFDTFRESKGSGIDNIKSRAIYYGGTATFISKPGDGCVLKVIFPVTHAILNQIPPDYLGTKN